jgi:folate-dependent tRNA-U54 methylase TrmFO/GidA
MNINWGLFPEPAEPTRDKGRKRELKLAAAEKGLQTWQEALREEGIELESSR